MKKLAHFLTYNNLVPITISVVLLGSSATYAYNNPETIYERSETVVSIDNTYIASLDFDRFSPSVEILAVEEDEEDYYVRYRFSTVALVDAVWQNVTTVEELQIPRANVGPSRDLGLYITEELRELVLAEEKRLRETQAFEQRQVTRKQVAVEYSGIIGGRLSPEIETIDGYDPRVTPPSERSQSTSAATPDERSTISHAHVPDSDSSPATPAMATDQTPSTSTRQTPTNPATSATPTDTDAPVSTSSAEEPRTNDATDITTNSSETAADETATTTSDSTTTPSRASDGESSGTSSNNTATTEAGSTTTPDAPPAQPATTTSTSQSDAPGSSSTSASSTLSITLLGSSPVEVPYGASYEDLGVVVTDTADGSFVVETSINGDVVPSIALDTEEPGEHTIEYHAHNDAGATARATRTVVVLPAAASTTDVDVDTDSDTVSDSEPTATTSTSSSTSSPDTSETDPGPAPVTEEAGAADASDDIEGTSTSASAPAAETE